MDIATLLLIALGGYVLYNALEKGSAAAQQSAAPAHLTASSTEVPVLTSQPTQGQQAPTAPIIPTSAGGSEGTSAPVITVQPPAAPAPDTTGVGTGYEAQFVPGSTSIGYTSYDPALVEGGAFSAVAGNVDVVRENIQSGAWSPDALPHLAYWLKYWMTQWADNPAYNMPGNFAILQAMYDYASSYK
jgi:hypothetical protein